MANPVDPLTSVSVACEEEVRDVALRHIRSHAELRRALYNLVTGVDTAFASFPSDSPEAKALKAALGAYFDEAETILLK